MGIIFRLFLYSMRYLILIDRVKFRVYYQNSIYFLGFMAERVNESVSVDLLFNHLKRRAYPWVVNWRGRSYRITKVGLHHTYRQGRTLYHVFSVTDGTTFFRLVFDTEFLGWKLTEVESG